MLRLLTVVALLATLTTPASSQILWDSPPLISPAVPGGLSLFMLNPAGGDLGGLATLRHSAGPVGLGYRAAVAQEDTSGDLAYSVGLDVSGYLARAVEGQGSHCTDRLAADRTGPNVGKRRVPSALNRARYSDLLIYNTGQSPASTSR